MAEQVELQAPVKTPANKPDDPKSTPVVLEDNTMDEAQESPSTAEEEEDNKSSKQEESDDGDEETPSGIKLETAPGDIRFPTTNQTRHCYTRYIEYHRCIAVKGEDAPECQKFAKYYRSLCPMEWVEKWNEQRANGTFPGPL